VWSAGCNLKLQIWVDFSSPNAASSSHQARSFAGSRSAAVRVFAEVRKKKRRSQTKDDRASAPAFLPARRSSCHRGSSRLPYQSIHAMPRALGADGVFRQSRKIFRPRAAPRALPQLQKCRCLLVRIEQIHGEIFGFDIAQFVETLVECDVDRRGPRSDSRDTPMRRLGLLRASRQGPTTRHCCLGT
jgi:hypothetical protein